MCGIFGGHPERLHPTPQIQLHHRGPDQWGQVTLERDHAPPMVLGQTRLNIVDRHNAETPMHHGASDSVLAFNGEIYNWRTLRDQLEGLGHVFESQTDTEVVLAAYQQWGPACLTRFNGMFALAIWDGHELFIARDRLGKKPLYYTHDAQGFAFASEVKGFAHLEYQPNPICEQLEFYFDQTTPFRGIHSLEPGTCMTYDPAVGSLEKTQWWRLPDPDPVIDDDRQAVRAFLDIFSDAVDLRLMADVPVTVFLSGGIDSSLIQAIAKCDVTYTCQFDEFAQTIDEVTLVNELAQTLGFEARVIRPNRDDFFRTLPEQARAIEFPVGSLSVYPLLCLARAAREGGYEVGLSGEGADELFLGYHRTQVLLDEDEHIAGRMSGPYRSLALRYFGTSMQRFCRMASRRGSEGIDPLAKLLSPYWDDARSFAQNISRVETSLFLQPLLAMADRMSMSQSLEMRNPFLDHRLVELSCQLSDRMKFRDGQGKWVVRAALEELLGPSHGVVKRRIKHGLPSPINLWLGHGDAFDRRDWNRLLLGECLKQLTLGQDADPASLRTDGDARLGL